MALTLDEHNIRPSSHSMPKKSGKKGKKSGKKSTGKKSGKKGKRSAKGGGSAKASKGEKTDIDILSKPAMENLYYIAHDAPQALDMRGFGWADGGGKGGKGKKGKKGKKKKK